MRKLLLLALVGGLVYFTWSRYGGGAADPAEPDGGAAAESPKAPGGTGAGQFLNAAHRAEAQEQLAQGAGAGPLPDAPEPGPAKVTPQREEPTPVAASPKAQQPPLGDLGALGDPLREGELLAHRVGDLQDYISGDGAGLSLSRRNLLIAYGLLIRGMPGQAQKYAKGLEEATDVTAEEWSLLSHALTGKQVRTRNASAKLQRSPLVLGASMGLMAGEAGRLLREQEWKRAAELYSELLLAEVDAPWPADRDALGAWSAGLEDAQANYRWNREAAWPSIEMTVKSGDSLTAIRKRVLDQRPNAKICTGLINRANQIGGRYLREGEVLRVPTDEVSVLVDLSAYWLFYLHGSEVVAAWPIATGKVGQETTPGTYTVGAKIPEPPWFPPGRGMVPYGDPENPLGTRWITLDDSPSLGIHGTWDPESIGTMASDGCVRLRNESVEQLFEILPQGSKVLIRP
ncbi:MAG: L,D-transpeptidase family protein [Planctomycetes bacterium]|nr:L,D-transpeptidase family protein [Planctomycetota bacterium]